MKHQLQTIREALQIEVTACQYEKHPVPDYIAEALTALAQIEADHYSAADMADAQAKAFRNGVASVQQGQEPVACSKCHGTGYYDEGHECDDGTMAGGNYVVCDKCAAPVAQQPKLEDIEQYRMQMAGICTAAIGYWKEADSIHPHYDTPALREVAKLYAKYDALYKAQQPQARPDFTDEWTGYLKDGETPFERFLRERKDLTALTKLYQRALEDNERLKAQQPQVMVDMVPPATVRDRWMYEQGRLAERDPRTHAAPQQAEAVPSLSPICLELSAEPGCRYKGLCVNCAAPQQAEAVPQKPKLIGWRTSDYLMETSDKDKADNWSVHHEMLPIFEGDPYTKLVASTQQVQATHQHDLARRLRVHLANRHTLTGKEFADGVEATLAEYYAAPQQVEAVPSDVVRDAAPIPDHELVTMYDERPTSDLEMIEFAREVERRHGIGVQPQHITDGSPCWCNPDVAYTDPETGASVIVHRRPQ